MEFRLRGAIPSIITPFSPEGGVDLDSLANLVEMEITAGAGGILLFDRAGVPEKLTLPEMQAIVALVTKKVSGRVPVIVSLPFAEPARAIHLAGNGAVDAFMVPPPRTTAPDAVIKVMDFRSFRRAARIPVILDFTSPPGIAPLESAEHSGLFKSLDEFPYIRVDIPPAGPLISAIRERSSGQSMTITGLAGLLINDGMDRGASAATILSCLPEPFISIIKYREHGALKEASEVYTEILPLLTSINQTPSMSVACEKIILARRGWIATDTRRDPSYSPDAKERSDLFTMYENLAKKLQLE